MGTVNSQANMQPPFIYPIQQQQQPQQMAYGNSINNSPVRPAAFMPIMSYEQQVINRQLLQFQQREYIIRQLRESFPLTFVIIHGILMILVGLAAVALEIACMVLGDDEGNGLWSGLIAFTIGVVTLVLSKEIMLLENHEVKPFH
jgi:hypothetical protein